MLTVHMHIHGWERVAGDDVASVIVSAPACKPMRFEGRWPDVLVHALEEVVEETPLLADPYQVLLRISDCPAKDRVVCSMQDVLHNAQFGLLDAWAENLKWEKF